MSSMVKYLPTYHYLSSEVGMYGAVPYHSIKVSHHISHLTSCMVWYCTVLIASYSRPTVSSYRGPDCTFWGSYLMTAVFGAPICQFVKLHANAKHQ